MPIHLLKLSQYIGGNMKTNQLMTDRPLNIRYRSLRDVMIFNKAKGEAVAMPKIHKPTGAGFALEALDSLIPAAASRS
jgi:hypothetical protein